MSEYAYVYIANIREALRCFSMPGHQGNVVWPISMRTYNIHIHVHTHRHTYTCRYTHTHTYIHTCQYDRNHKHVCFIPMKRGGTMLKQHAYIGAWKPCARGQCHRVIPMTVGQSWSSTMHTCPSKFSVSAKAFRRNALRICICMRVCECMYVCMYVLV